MLEFVYKREIGEDNENLSCILLIFSENSIFFSLSLFIDCDQKTEAKQKNKPKR